MVERILGTSRFLILIAVIGSFISSAILIIYGGLTVVTILVDAFRHIPATPENAKLLTVNLIEMIDVFLLGTVLYIVAAGLYTLFIGPLELPSWLRIHSLDELKSQLVMVIIVLLAVTFLGKVVIRVDINTLYMGIAIALVIVALGYVMRYGHDKVEPTPPTVEQQNHSHES
jgi:uncharacterized membrane protein YqhA